VLGHEIEHIARRHALKMIERGNLLQGLGSVAQVSLTATGKGGSMVNYSQSIGQLTDSIIQKGFDPKTEYYADARGAQLATVVGYAPDGLKQFLEELKKRQTTETKMFPTHPPLQSRIDKLSSGGGGRR
nr:M48 family metalloprotease [Verrucomicrobiae bacterium]